MRSLPVVLILSGALLCGCRSVPLAGESDSAPEPDAGAAYGVLTPHFFLRWSKGQASPAEVEAVQQRAEAAYARYSELLGPERMPAKRINVRLAGDAPPDGASAVSAETGELTLVRFPASRVGYAAAVAREVVHALRWSLWTQPKLQTDPFLFLEEGFAEVMAAEAGFPSEGFPTYGFPVAVAAGGWLQSGKDLPIPTLALQHRAVYPRCKAQAAALGLSFFTYLRERFGLDPLIRLAYAEEPLDAAGLLRVFHADLATLGQEWKAWALQQFTAAQSPEQQAADYWEHTPIHALKVCGPDGS